LPDDDVKPLTASDVAELWEQATTKPDHRPTLAMCDDIAATLNQHLRQPEADHHHRDRDRTAAELIHKLLHHVSDDDLAIFETVPPVQPSTYRVRPFEDYAKLAALRLALLEALPIYQPGVKLSPEQAIWFGATEGGSARAAALVKAAAEGPLRRPRTPPWERTAIICWMVARDTLNKLGHRAGTSQNTVAVKFAAAATNRMGFAGVTSLAVAKRLQSAGIK
jgi:hypothetical protein